MCESLFLHLCYFFSFAVQTQLKGERTIWSGESKVAKKNFATLLQNLTSSGIVQLDQESVHFVFIHHLVNIMGEKNKLSLDCDFEQTPQQWRLRV